MNEQYLVSVIVPVYNVKNYLDRCVTSICEQSYGKLEILLIDDGSTDGSGSICDELAAKDSRIKVYHKVNGGLSDARNSGINKSEGEYLVFIDSDDYVGIDYVKTLLSLSIDNNVKLSVVGMKVTYSEEKDFRDPGTVNSEKISFEEAFKRMCTWKGFGVSACAKLYHRSLFDGIRYPVGKLHEDMATTPWLMEKCDHIAVSNAPLYYYFQRQNSIMNGTISLKNFVLLDTMKVFVDYFGNKYPELKSYAEERAVRDTLTTLVDPILYQDDYMELMTVYRDSFYSILKNAKDNPVITRLRKYQVRLILKDLSAHRRVFKVVNKVKKILKR